MAIIKHHLLFCHIHFLKCIPPLLKIAVWSLSTRKRLTNGATVSFVSGHHQSRAPTFVHCIDLCPMAKHQLKSCNIFSEGSSMQWGPAGTERDSSSNYCTVTPYKLCIRHDSQDADMRLLCGHWKGGNGVPKVPKKKGEKVHNRVQQYKDKT